MPDPYDAELDVRLAREAEIDDMLAILCEAYGRDTFDRSWFSWKHRLGPWGPSRPYIAEAPEGPAGVFFALPWQYRRDGEYVDGVRTVDGATLPPARGRRVLGRLIAAELARWGDDHPGTVVATATPTAQRSHARNGAATLDPIVSYYGVPRTFRPARIRRDIDLLDTAIVERHSEVSTDWTPAALRWRIDPRSGHHYDVAALAQADEPHGMVYRVATIRRVRILCPILVWGPSSLVDRLVGAVAVAERCVALLEPHGSGTPGSHLRPVRSAGSTVMCVWDRTGRPDPAVGVDHWRFSMADIEGLI